MTVCQKLGVILESKLIFLDKFFLTSKIDFESTILALFDKLLLLVGFF